MSHPILTDRHGHPVERPDPPPVGAGGEAVLAWLAAMNRYDDAVRALGSRAFDSAFRRAVRR